MQFLWVLLKTFKYSDDPVDGEFDTQSMYGFYVASCLRINDHIDVLSCVDNTRVVWWNNTLKYGQPVETQKIVDRFYVIYNNSKTL